MLWFGWRGRIRTFGLLIQSQVPLVSPLASASCSNEADSRSVRSLFPGESGAHPKTNQVPIRKDQMSKVPIPGAVPPV